MKYRFTFLFIAVIYLGAEGAVLSQLQNDSLPEIAEMISKHQYHAVIGRLEAKPPALLTVEMLNMAGYSYSALGRYREAVDAYKRSLELDSTNITTLSRLADLYKNRDEFLKASELYKKLSSADSLNSYFFRQNAYCLYKAGFASFSIALYEKAHRLNPDDEEVVSSLAGLHMKFKRFTRCDSLLNRSLARDSGNTRLLSLKARNKYYQKQYDSTIVVLTGVFFRGDTSLGNVQLAANTYYAMREYAESLSWFEMLPPEARKEDEHIQYMMGVCYNQLDQAEKSVHHLKKAIELGISDNIALYYQQLGLSYEDLGSINQALAAFETARKYKKEGIVYYQMARIHDYYKHDPETALEYYRRYLGSGDSSAQSAWEFSRKRVRQLE